MKKTLLLISAIYLAGGGVTALANESAQTTISVEACSCLKFKPGRIKGYGCNRDGGFDYSSPGDFENKWKANRCGAESYFDGNVTKLCNYSFNGFRICNSGDEIYICPNIIGSCKYYEHDNSGSY